MGTLNYLFDNRGYLTPEKPAVRQVSSREINPFSVKRQQISYKKRDGATTYIVSPALEWPKVPPMKHAKFAIKRANTEDVTTEESRLSEYEILTQQMQEKLSECRELVKAVN